MGQGLAQGVADGVGKEALRMTPFMLSALGSYAKEAEMEGANPLQQLAYGTVMAMLEGASEKIPFDEWFKVDKKGVMSWIKSMGIEGLQELIMDPASGFMKKYLSIKPDMPWKGEGGVFDPEQMKESFIGGAGTGALMAGVSSAGNRVLEMMNRKAKQQTNTQTSSAPVNTEIVNQYQGQPQINTMDHLAGKYFMGAPGMFTPVEDQVATALEQVRDRPVSREQQILEKIKNMSTDEIVSGIYRNYLTGLWNKRAYQEAVQTARAGSTFVNIDLNSLKAVNDNIGHHAGDALISSFGQVFSEIGKKYGIDNLFHVSGDEFHMIAPPGFDVVPMMTELEKCISQ